MAYVSLLFCVSVALASAGAQVTPTGYRIDLYPYPGDGVFKGRVRIDLVYSGIGEGPKQINLQADPSLNIVEREIGICRLAYPESSEEEDVADMTIIGVDKTERVNQTLSVYFSQALQRDTSYQIDIQFDGILGADTSSVFFQSSYVDQASGEQRWFVVLNLKPYRARYVFPCFDAPEFKTWIELSVAHKSEFHILSSMPVTDTTNVTTEGVWVREHFSRTPPMSINSLALFVSDFPHPISNNLQTETDGIRVGVWGRSDFVTALSMAQQLLPTVMVSLEIYLSRPYPLPQLNLVALPGFTDDSPINAWGLQLFKESDLMNGNTYWLTHRLAKAAAMQWLNHLTTPNCSCSCVTPGLANFLAATVTKQLEQQNIYHWHLNGLHSLYLEYSKPKSSYMNANQKESLCASKVQIFLSMMNSVLTPATFKTGIQNFLSKKEFKMYTDDEVWDALTEQAHQDITLLKKLNVREIAQSWLGRDRLPVVTVTRNYKLHTVTFIQENFVNHLESRWTPSKVVKKPSPPEQFWFLPLVLKIETDDEEQSMNITTNPREWMTPWEKDLTLSGFDNDDNRWLLVNARSIGPFMVNYDHENWRMLAAKMFTLPDDVRAQLMHDVLTFALAGQLETTVALNTTVFLRKEQSATVWRTFYPLADRLRKQFQGTAVAKPLDEYIQALVAPVLEALGEETDKSPVWRTDLRTKTRHLLCEAGHPACVEHAQVHYARWVQSPTPDSGMPLAGSMLCSVFSYGTPEEWEFGMQRLVNFPTNRSSTERLFLLKSLARCTRDPEQYDRLLNTTLLDDITNQTFSEADKFATLTAMSSNTLGCSALFNFLTENWKPLRKRCSLNLWEYLIQVSLGKFRTEEGLIMVRDLVLERKGEFINAERTAEEAVEAVKAQVEWCDKNCGPVEKWLTEAMSKPWPPHRFKFQDILVSMRTRKSG